MATKKPNQQIRLDDILTFPAGPHVRVIRVIALGKRRGPAAEAQTLYEDMAPPVAGGAGRFKPIAGRVALREPGAGRPTKRDRRILDQWKGGI